MIMYAIEGPKMVRKIEKVILGCACVVMIAPYLPAALSAARHPRPLKPHMLLGGPHDQHAISSGFISPTAMVKSALDPDTGKERATSGFF